MTSDNSEQTTDPEHDENPSECGAGCSCNKTSLSTNIKVIVCVVIAFAATVVLANGFMNKAGAQTNQSQVAFASSLSKTDSFAMSPSCGDTSKPSNGETPLSQKVDEKTTSPVTGGLNEREKIPDQELAIKPSGIAESIPGSKDAMQKGQSETALWGDPLDSLTTLNTIAQSKGAVFVFLPGKRQSQNEKIKKVIDKAAEKAKSRGTVMGAYILNNTAQEYQMISKQSPAPCVLVLVKRAGSSAVTGEITEEKLLQALVTASRPASACCPSSDPSKSKSDCK